MCVRSLYILSVSGFYFISFGSELGSRTVEVVPALLVACSHLHTQSHIRSWVAGPYSGRLPHHHYVEQNETAQTRPNHFGSRTRVGLLRVAGNKNYRRLHHETARFRISKAEPLVYLCISCCCSIGIISSCGSRGTWWTRWQFSLLTKWFGLG